MGIGARAFQFRHTEVWFGAGRRRTIPGK
jgi:hypothetical protein